MSTYELSRDPPFALSAPSAPRFGLSIARRAPLVAVAYVLVTGGSGAADEERRHAWRRPDGSFAGLIVGPMDPEFFDKAWIFDAEIAGLSIALTGRDGGMIMRRPFDDDTVGEPVADTATLGQLSSGRPADTRLSGDGRLLAYRRVAAYANLMVFVSQPTGAVLAGWQRVADELADGEGLKTLQCNAASAERAQDLTRQMLAFSRKQPLRPRPANVNDLVTDTGKLLRRALGEQVEMIRSRPASCGPSMSTAPSSRPRWSISASTRATPCQEAGAYWSRRATSRSMPRWRRTSRVSRPA
jgi:hypothetical protein